MRENKKTTTVSLDDDVYDALNRAAKAERRTMSSYLNKLLADLLIENEGNENPFEY